jgi:hypothetical protein
MNRDDQRIMRAAMLDRALGKVPGVAAGQPQFADALNVTSARMTMARVTRLRAAFRRR